MATTIPRQARMRRNVPGDRVLHLINPFVSAILRSPLHGLLSKQVMLLTYAGRKTGRPYAFPVEYAREGDILVVFSSHSWWRNLRGGAPVEVLLQGRRYHGTAAPRESSDEAMAAVEKTIASFGLKGASQRLGMALDGTPPLSREEIAQAMQGHAVIRIKLDDQDAAPAAA